VGRVFEAFVGTANAVLKRRGFAEKIGFADEKNPAGAKQTAEKGTDLGRKTRKAYLRG